ncbi:MAG: hypothetical protein VX689_04355 [Bacteroidota bacterium]|nr:hypothetical protein [Bacteroidota bacterium]
MSKFEKEKLLHLLECTENELDILIQKANDIADKETNTYDVVLKILQQGFNIREAVLSGIILGEKLGYEKAKVEMEEEIKEKLYRAFKNNQ